MIEITEEMKKGFTTKNPETFILRNQYGAERLYEVLFTFQNPEMTKHYIIFTDNTFAHHRVKRIFAGTYDPDAESIQPIPLQSDEEWEMAKKLLDSLWGNPTLGPENA